MQQFRAADVRNGLNGFEPCGIYLFIFNVQTAIAENSAIILNFFDWNIEQKQFAFNINKVKYLTSNSCNNKHELLVKYVLGTCVT